MSKGVDILKLKSIWKLSFTLYCINPKDGRTTQGKFGYVRDYTSPSEENYIQALNRGMYHAVKTAQEMIERNPDWSIARISWADRIYPCNDKGGILINDGIDISIDDYTPTPEDLKTTYQSEIIFESMDCCINCGRKEGPYSDAKLVACKGCPELVCQYCNLQELGCKLCYKEDDLSFEADYFYGLGDYYEEDPNLWEHWDKYRIRHRVRDAILKMPTDKAWEYIIWIDSQDGAISEEENEAWETALTNKDLEAALQNLIIERGYINEGWGTGIINELEDHNYYQSETFEADMTKEGRDYVSRKIATIMRDWKKTGKIGNSSPKDSKTAQRQAIAVAFSMAARKGFKGTKKAEEDYFYFDELAKKHGIMSNKLLLGSLAVVLSIASIGNMMVKTAVNAKELRVEEKTESGCGCGCKKKGGCN